VANFHTKSGVPLNDFNTFECVFANVRFHRRVFIQISLNTSACAGVGVVWQKGADRQYCYEKRKIKINFSIPGP